LDSASNFAASDKGHTGALYSKNSDPAAKVGMALFTTALGLYGGVLWSGELQGLIIHEMVHTDALAAYWCNGATSCQAAVTGQWTFRVDYSHAGLFANMVAWRSTNAGLVCSARARQG
jgi:hypothetical protein